MRALPDVWVHRRPNGLRWGPLDEAGTTPAPATATATRTPESRATTAARARRTTWEHVLTVLTRNEFRARYRSQALGILWSLLNPLVQMGILTLVFSHVPGFKSATRSYPVYLLIGVVIWQFFSTAITAGTQSFIAHADIVKRTVFAREILPVATVLSYGFNFAMEAGLVLALVPLMPYAFRLSPALLLVPIILLVLVALLFGLVLMTSVLNVVYRDVAYLVSTGLALLYWLTPIIYPVGFVPEPYATALHFNPLWSILIALRGCVMDGTLPSGLTWAGMLAPTLVMLAIGWAIFRHYERMVLDYV
jgi:ABC-type polysaccharide/polyol phosphate export permease